MRHVWATAAFVAVASGAWSVTDSFTFANNTGKEVNDLHIEWSRAVKITKATKFAKYTDTEKSSSDLSKGTVADSDSCEVTVTYDGTDPKIKSWHWTIGGKKVRNEDPKAPCAVTTTVTHGLNIVTLKTANGPVHAYLPENLFAGEVVRGTVVAAPTDPSTSDRLEGVVVEVGSGKGTVGGGTLVATIGAVGTAVILFRDGQGNPLGSTTLPAIRPIANPVGALPKTIVAQAGRPVTIPMPCDPQVPIEATIAGSSAAVIAANSRSVVVAAPASVSGWHSIVISTGGKEATCMLALCDLKLSVPKRTLLAGEQSSLTVQVGPLDDFPETAFPLFVQLRIDSGPNLRFSKAATPQSLTISIDKADVGANGWFSETVAVQATAPGGFVVAGELVSDSCGDAKHITKYERLSKGGNEEAGWFVEWTEVCYAGKCTKKSGHTGDHAYATKKCGEHKDADKKKRTFDTKKERDDFFKEMEKKAGG